MGLFKRKNGGFMDVIRCDEPSYLIWKWHPVGSQPGHNKKENAIRWGSSLRVKDGEVAVFVYTKEDGTMQDFIEGPFDQVIETSNLPILTSIVGLVYDGASPFQAEVYFINLAKIIQVKFGVPFFDVYDPRFDDFGVPVAVRGSISFSIRDYREFIKLHRLDTFSLEMFQAQIRDAVTRYIKDVVANAPSANNIPVVQIESKISQINDAIQSTVSERLKENFGVVVSGVDISAIEIDKTSDGYQQLMRVSKDVTSATVRAEAEAKIKDIHDKQRIEAENYEESLRIQRDEAQYAQHKQTQTANFVAYQVEKQAEVGVAGAQALGQMANNGATEVHEGNFNPAGMVTGMAMGSAIGQNMAGMMNGMLGNINTVPQTSITPPPIPGSVPPPLPTATLYHVAIDGRQTGPFDSNTLKQMIAAGTLKKESLVWTVGMESWKAAESVGEINALFTS